MQAVIKVVLAIIITVLGGGNFQGTSSLEDLHSPNITGVPVSPQAQPVVPTRPISTAPVATPTMPIEATPPSGPIEATALPTATASPVIPTVPATTPDVAPAPSAPPVAAPTAPFPTGQAVPPPSGEQCIAEPGATQQDVDTEDSENGIWPHTPGQKTKVYFSYGGMPERYARAVQEGVTYWSLSPCIEAIAVEQCPADANCSTVGVEPTAGDGDTDGDHTGEDSGGVRTGSTIILYTDLLDAATDNGVLATAVHEMGHALGLIHRTSETSLMHEVTADKTSAMPDEIDFANLLALYGQEGDAAVVSSSE